MKRIAALLLAVMLIFSTAPAAYATMDETAIRAISVNPTFALEDIFGRVSEKVSTDYLAGKTLYYEVTLADSGAVPSQLALVNYEVSWQINSGGARIKSAGFTKRQNDQDKEHTYLAVKLKETYQNGDDTTLDANITITAKNGWSITDKTKATTDTYSLPLIGEAKYGVAEQVGNGLHSVQEPIVSFAQDANNVILCFDCNVEVSGNMQGNSNLFLRLSAYDDELQSAYPYAQLRVFEGNRKTFTHPVTVKIPIPAAEGKNGKPVAPYIYEWRDGVLYKIENAVYKMNDELFTFQTKTLGSYVISDEELIDAVEQEPAAPETKTSEQWAFSNDAEENPQTGCM